MTLTFGFDLDSVKLNQYTTWSPTHARTHARTHTHRHTHTPDRLL